MIHSLVSRDFRRAKLVKETDKRYVSNISTFMWLFGTC
jgi:hypothetical protein